MNALQINPVGGKIVHLPQTSDDPCRRRPDITVARRELGWSPQVSVDEGLDKTILYFRHELGATLLDVRCGCVGCHG
jgi:nucleoside-diphosphate-sugar epimerase